MYLGVYRIVREQRLFSRCKEVQLKVGLKCNWNLPTAGRAYSDCHWPDAIASAASSRVGRTGATQLSSTRPIGVGSTRPAPTAQARPLRRRTSVLSTKTPSPHGVPVWWPPATVVGRNRSICASSNHHQAQARITNHKGDEIAMVVPRFRSWRRRATSRRRTQACVVARAPRLRSGLSCTDPRLAHLPTSKSSRCRLHHCCHCRP